MKVLFTRNVDMSAYGKVDSCSVHCVHVKIKDIDGYARELTSYISDTSWIKPLGAVEQAAFDKRSDKTIKKLVNDVISKVQGAVTEDFGEFMVSSAAQSVLHDIYEHTKVPLAELWKEKIIGNPGFDFHTESNSGFLVFGEAKYSSSVSPYTVAINQIAGFVEDGKDFEEISDLQHFVSEEAIINFLEGNRSFVVAFSLNGSVETVLKNLLTSDNIDKLLVHKELYITAIEVEC